MDITQKSGVDESKYDPYLMYTNTSEGVDAITRWKQHIWNNMAARMKWSVTNKYKDANHHPVACANGDNTRQVLEYTVEANSKIRLDANKSTDPDGNKLHFNWSFYKEPSSYNGTISILDSESAISDISIPSDAHGKSIHIILELSDDG